MQIRTPVLEDIHRNVKNETQNFTSKWKAPSIFISIRRREIILIYILFTSMKIAEVYQSISAWWSSSRLHISNWMYTRKRKQRYKTLDKSRDGTRTEKPKPRPTQTKIKNSVRLTRRVLFFKFLIESRRVVLEVGERRGLAMIKKKNCPYHG